MWLTLSRANVLVRANPQPAWKALLIIGLVVVVVVCVCEVCVCECV